METNAEMLVRIEEEDFALSLERFIENHGWNVFEEITKQLKQRYNPKEKKIKGEYSICSCITSLAEKTHLNHRERLALMMILLPLEKEEMLMEIMRRQDNYNEKITMYQINNYKSKGRYRGISKSKLKEWGICKC